MKDRVSAKPNRYAVYDDSHNFIRYEYHERADEPTEAGSALNKANLLPDDVATALGLTGDPQVKDALLKIKDAMDSAAAKAKIETGSYIGTGTYGSSARNSLTFGFVPKLVFISRASNHAEMGQVRGTGDHHALIPYSQLASVTGTTGHYFKSVDGSSSDSTHSWSCFCNLSSDKKTITWHSTVGSFEQLNSADLWVYVAIG